jgi:hypothetical protein
VKAIVTPKQKRKGGERTSGIAKRRQKRAPKTVGIVAATATRIRTQQ